MRKLFITLIAAGATVAAVSGATAAPLPGRLPILSDGARLQTVQYYHEDGQYRGDRRAEHERWRRHQEWLRWHHHHGW